MLVVEPNIRTLPPQVPETVRLVTLEEALAAADVVAVLVNHKQFITADRTLLKDKALIDTRGIWRTEPLS